MEEVRQNSPTKEDREAIDTHCQEISETLKMVMIESEKLDRKKIIGVLTRSENILLNITEKYFQ